MSWNDILAATALEQAALIRSRALSSEELTRLYLDRIEEHDSRLSAFVLRFRRRALREARTKDQQVRAGGALPAFHGVPVGVKDLNFVRLAPSRFGTRGLPPIYSPIDDQSVSSIRRGGFVILGKLATSEFGAMPVTEPDIHPPTRNPWNLDHSPGGSSGGSAAAVAAGLLPIAHGSDGAGSIRIPSAFCHLFGIKPSRGRVRNAYARPDRDLLYTCGPLARSVEDAAAMLDVLAGLDARKPHWAPPPPGLYRDLCQVAPRRLRIRFAIHSPLAPTHPEIGEAVVRAARTLGELGHEVEEGTFPPGTVEEFLPLWQHVFAILPLIRWPRTQPVTRWLAEAGRGLRSEDMLALLRRLGARVLHDFGDADLWLTPTVVLPAPRVGAFTGRPPAEAFAEAAQLGVFTAPCNLTGQPAASLPLGLTSEGMPMGLQLIGRPFGDEVVLAVSRQLEEAMPWRSRHAMFDAPRPA